jgi:hypothetical protein
VELIYYRAGTPSYNDHLRSSPVLSFIVHQLKLCVTPDRNSLEAAQILSLSACRWARRDRLLFGNVPWLRKLEIIVDLHLSAQALGIKKRLPHRHLKITFCGDNVYVKL